MAMATLSPFHWLPALRSPPKMTVVPRAALRNGTPPAGVPYDLKQGQYRHFHRLPSRLSLEVIVQKSSGCAKVDSDSDRPPPPLVFVHGSYHASWCWAEHWLPFFSGRGYDCFAISLLGQGESDAPPAAVAGTLESHANDVAHFIMENFHVPPVLLGHSFGGLVVQYYVAKMKSWEEKDGLLPELAGAVLVCSVPPFGNSGIVWRYVFSKPVAAFKVTRSLAAKAFQTSLPLCRETFFSPSMRDDVVRRYQGLMKESSQIPLFDLRKLNASLPVPPPKSLFRLLVLGAEDDLIVDAQAIRDTGSFYGVEPVIIQGIAHDMMLDCSWDKGAEAILLWLKNL
ncbi:hypothetical protein MLD38_002681 [Melastoma candidum]|uniref:Uncharacterized protein n=1 Tax=Melastoma candidum TaxID=119954 RepID=A0ACB9RZK2_9MYRT|nr:hypothetical protein MLD38_002681 [Melastoma candidum]